MADRSVSASDGSGTADPLPQAQRAITELMTTLDRTDPLREAQFAALEAVLSLLRAGSAHQDQRTEAVGMLREALSAARATVVATGYVLIRTNDLHRASTAASRQTNSRSAAEPTPGPSSEQSGHGRPTVS